MNTRQSQLSANNLIRDEVLGGKTFAVVPVVALVAGVVNGEFAPREEIGRFVEAWNGRPVPLGHPVRGGRHISANDPAGLSSSLGWFFNAHMDGDKLRGEMWLDTEHIARLGGDAVTTLQRLRLGEHVEVSTAYFNDVEGVSGEVGGTPFSGIQRNLRPDHIALLPNAIGACSWQDGCGAPRINQKGEQTMEDVTGTTATVTPTTNEGEAPAAEVLAVAAPPVAPTSAPVAEALPAELAELLQVLRDVGGVAGLRALLTEVSANSQRERGQLVAAITANGGDFSKAELDAMPTASLEKIARLARPGDYGARVGATATVAAGEWRTYRA